MPVESFMRMAIEKAAEGIRDGQLPFGAVIVRGADVVACVHNVVRKQKDPTAHAEVMAIRRACAELGATDLSGCDIYCTCEPCMMCFGACYWSNFRSIVYGAAIADKNICGLRDMTIGAVELKQRGNAPAEIVSGFLRDECVPLFEAFARINR